VRGAEPPRGAGCGVGDERVGLRDAEAPGRGARRAGRGRAGPLGRGRAAGGAIEQGRRRGRATGGHRAEAGPAWEGA
jgi:hypothetical protein